MTLSARKQSDFVEYLLSFYGKEGIYGPSNPNPIFRPAMSKKEAVLAADIVGAGKDFEGASFDREKARDLVLSWRDSTSKKPPGSRHRKVPALAPANDDDRGWLGNRERNLNDPEAPPPGRPRGLISYRLRGPYGYIGIGARDHEDAMREAARSTRNPDRAALEVWKGSRWVKAF